jgi:hypothetical protein
MNDVGFAGAMELLERALTEDRDLKETMRRLEAYILAAAIGRHPRLSDAY